MRLFASVLICIVFIGALASSILHVMDAGGAFFTWRFFGAAAGGLACFLAAVFVLARQWPLEKFLQRVGLLAVFLYSGFLAIWLTARFEGSLQAGSDASTGRILVAVLSFQGMALVFVHGFLREHETGWAEAFGLRRGRARAAIFGIVVAIVALPVAGRLQQLSGFVLERMRISSHEQQAVEALCVPLLARRAWGCSRLPRSFWCRFRRKCCSAAFFTRRSSKPDFHGWRSGARPCSLVRFTGTWRSFCRSPCLPSLSRGLYERTGNLLAPIWRTVFLTQ